MRLQVLSVVAFAATFAAAAEADYACYFKCAHAAPARKNGTLTEAETQCVTQTDSAKIFRCVCESKVLQGAIHYCMFQTCDEELDRKNSLFKQSCDISDSKLANLLGDGENSATGRAIGGAAWLAAGATALGTILFA